MQSNAATGFENKSQSDSIQLLNGGSNQSTKKRALLNIGGFLPLHDFSTSIYGVPMLLLFRLFYQAAPFALQKPQMECARFSEKATFGQPRKLRLKCDHHDQHDQRHDARSFLDIYSKMEVSDFLETLRNNPDLGEGLILKSITWVKALASPLSHEYLQFLVYDRRDERTRRLVVERSDMGDILTVGWDWSSEQYASHHHVLPLPLITLSFEGARNTTPLSLQTFAETLSSISEIRPYRLLREMCWWYAEKVLIETARQFPGVAVQEWPFASLRYSFVVRTEWIKRPILVKAAEEFRKMNTQSMKY